MFNRPQPALIIVWVRLSGEDVGESCWEQIGSRSSRNVHWLLTLRRIKHSQRESSLDPSFCNRFLLKFFDSNSGNYEKARPFVANVVIDSLKAQRTAKLQGLRMNWKLHKVVEQTVVCAREQEIFKKDEQVGQMAVRFVTEQVSLNPICATC